MAQRAFFPLLALGVLERLYLLLSFGIRRVSEDDAIIWSAAVDYGHGFFREPYFYGQDYAVMLEALVAAPFARLGVPLHILMPTVTTLLAMAPFWSFACWHRKHHRPLAALAFLAMPAILPVEYGVMTTLTRCFVSGIAPLALLPWLLDMRRGRRQALLAGMAASAAAFINPNSLVFSAAFITWYVLHRPGRIRRAAWLLTGTLPFVAAHLAAQAYCHAYPERMMHVVNDWRMTFHPGELIPESFGMLNLHFQWLFPLAPAWGGLAFAALAAMATWHLFRGNKLLGSGLLAALLLIVVSFAFPKTHDGFGNPYFPYSRMFLAVPLLLCWGLGNLGERRPAIPWAAGALLLAGAAAAWISHCRLPAITSAPVPGHIPVNEIKLGSARTDARRMARLKEEYDVGLITGSGDWNNRINVRLRCYLYPLIQPGLSPTYMLRDRRYWQHDRFAERVVPNLLIVAAPRPVREHWPPEYGRLIDVSDSLSGPLHVLLGNILPTDSLLECMDRFPDAP